MSFAIPTSGQGIDKYASLSYTVVMINTIKNKYYTYEPNQFLPIYVDGALANRNEFHLYKFKRVASRVGTRLAHGIDRAFTQ